MEFSQLGRISSVNLTEETPEKAAYFIVRQVNEMVPNSNTRNCTPDLGEGEPFTYGLATMENETMEYDRICNNYRKEIVEKLETLGECGDTKYKIGLIAQEAINTRCGDCEEAAYVGAFVLRNNGYQGNIKIMCYGPVDDENAIVYCDRNMIALEIHVFLLLEGFSNNPSWVADIWSKKSFPYSDWRNQLQGYGTKFELPLSGGKCYGCLVPPNQMPGEEPRDDIKFSELYPSLALNALEQETASSL